MTHARMRKEVQASTVITFTEKEFQQYRKPHKRRIKHTERHCCSRCSENKTKSDSNNSSRNEKTHESQRKTEKQTSTNQDTIFTNHYRNNFDYLKSEVIRADCMSHGYKVEKTIGEGAYAKVKLAEVMPSKMARIPEMADYADYEGTLKVAIKVIDAKNVPKEFLTKFLPRELSNHVPLPPNKNVVRVFEQFKTNNRYYVVMEFCCRGDLLDRINQSISDNKKGLGEERSRNFFRMMVEGVHHIHTNGIVHRDLKCENILIDKEECIKVTDFGFSTQFTPGFSELLKTSCGSYAYTAPEVIKSRPYDGTKSDVWSMGIILFAMLNGRLPYNDNQITELEEDMKMQRLKFERTVSFESMVLVRRILQFNPSNRPSTAEILADPWLSGRKAIPRQPAKMKWTTAPSSSQEESNKSPQVSPRGSSSVYYKGVTSERGLASSAVTINHQRQETVVLKSRAASRKNIWIRGPLPQRPKTWPRRTKPGDQTSFNRGSSSRRTSAAAGSKVLQAGQESLPEDVQSKPVSPDPVAEQNTTLSKWFIEKHLAGKETVAKAPIPDKSCLCCQVEETPKSTGDTDETLPCDKGDVSAFSKTETFKPVVQKQDMREGRLVEVDDKKPPRPNTCAQFHAISPRPSPVKTNRTQSASRGALEQKKFGVVSCKNNTRTTHVDRIKYFRASIMLNNKDGTTMNVGQKGLPPLLVQAIGKAKECPPKKPAPGTKEAVPVPPPTPPPASRKSSASWRGGKARVTSGSKPPVKPVQRVVVHSSVL